jgi:hypothetical protein
MRNSGSESGLILDSDSERQNTMNAKKIDASEVNPIQREIAEYEQWLWEGYTTFTQVIGRPIRPGQDDIATESGLHKR